jgi:hypothetical protein
MNSHIPDPFVVMYKPGLSTHSITRKKRMHGFVTTGLLPDGSNKPDGCWDLFLKKAIYAPAAAGFASLPAEYPLMAQMYERIPGYAAGLPVSWCSQTGPAPNLV